MKKLLAIFSIALMAATAACTGQKSGNSSDQTADNADSTAVYTYKDSNQHVIVTLSLELPVGTDEASKLIRDSLIANFALTCTNPGYGGDDNFGIKPYSGDMSDPQAIVNYYGKADFDFFLENAMADYNDRMKYVEEDSTMSPEEKETVTKYTPRWAFDFNVKQTTDAPKFVVYQSQAYIYLGGAHGGVTGSGDLTFDKATGAKISRFLKADATDALQPLFRQGLATYFQAVDSTITASNFADCLFLNESKIIPQPAYTPCPNAAGDSLIFTYQQYEIASYAAGMPSFALPVKALEPYLTPEAKALLTK